MGNRGYLFLKRAIKLIAAPFFPVHSMRREYVKELIKKLLGKPNRFKAVHHLCKSLWQTYLFQVLAWVPMTFFYENKKKIKRLKGSHLGERCFFIGLGPSLKIEDLERLKGEVTFALNDIFALYNQTDWRPACYFFQESITMSGDINQKVFEKKFGLLHSEMSFFPLNKHTNATRKIVPSAVFLPIVEDWVEYYLDEMKNFSTNCAKIVNAAYLSMYSVLQLAVYMGFKEVYLIGCDAKYTVSKPHCYDRSESDDRYFRNEREAQASTLGINRGFRGMRYAADTYGIKIFNATRGGYLEEFPRVDFDALDLK